MRSIQTMCVETSLESLHMGWRRCSQHWHELIYDCNSSPTGAGALIWTCGTYTLAHGYIQTKINETLQNPHTVDIC